MDYYKVIGLDKEPFSTSPDPSFFYLSREHKAAFCRLQIAITLKRGLSVIIGDVGTGKTTLSRKLARLLKEDENVEFHMILNPYFKSEKQFLSRLARLLHINMPDSASGLDYMEAIERFLFKQGVEGGKTVVLLMDEAQILPDFVLETLRILLNYETNEYKILQLVLMGQMELMPRISRISNFWDRIALRYMLNPLGRDEVPKMMEYRLRQAGYKGMVPLFTNEAVEMICEYTQCYPRKLTQFCHNSLESLVMYDKKIVDEDIVQKVIDADIKSQEFGMLPEGDAKPKKKKAAKKKVAKKKTSKKAVKKKTAEKAPVKKKAVKKKKTPVKKGKKVASKPQKSSQKRESEGDKAEKSGATRSSGKGKVVTFPS